MGRTLSAPFLLAHLAACTGESRPPSPPALSIAPPAASTTPPAPMHPTATRGSAYTEEVDALFDALSLHDSQSKSVPPTANARSISRAVTYTIPRVTREITEPDARAAERAAYQDNLETCLDGRFPAFCEHGRLDASDAAWVQEAEYQANLTTCGDPIWQHLCRPDLLPAKASLPPAIAAPTEP